MYGAGKENAQPAAVLVLDCIAGPSKGTTFSKQAERITLGRTKKSLVHVSDPSVSERHGEFLWDGSVWRFADRGSSNGSKLNDLTLRENEEAALQPGDVLTVGEATRLSVDIRPVADADMSVEQFLAAESERLAAGLAAQTEHAARMLRAELSAAKAELMGAAAGEGAGAA